MKKRLFFNRELGGDSADRSQETDAGRPYDVFQACSEEDATVITSLSDEPFAKGYYHYPTLDIDLPCELRESSPGRYHLYIDKSMAWQDYRMLLDVLATVGIIERGYADASIAKGATALRKPGTFKNPTIMREGQHTYDINTEVVVDRATWNSLRALVGPVPTGEVFA